MLGFPANAIYELTLFSFERFDARTYPKNGIPKTIAAPFGFEMCLAWKSHAKSISLEKFRR
jgi:hypothetical protein